MSKPIKWVCGLLLLWSAILLQGCGDPIVVQDKHTFSDVHPWTYQDSLEIDFEISDTSQYYDLKLCLDFLDTYPYQNLYLKIGTKYPDNAWVYSQLNVDLAYPDGKWVGDCSGHNCSAEINLIQNFYFREVGSYAISVAQYTRTDSLKDMCGAKLYLSSLGG